MSANRMFSLNEISTDFSVEELEPRLEMQMLGIGADPSILEIGDRVFFLIFCTNYGYCYLV
jgi:hypothetical protein